MGKSPLDLGPVTAWLQGDISVPHPKTKAFVALPLCLVAYGAVFWAAFHCNRDWDIYVAWLRKHVNNATGERTSTSRVQILSIDERSTGRKHETTNDSKRTWRKLLAGFGLWLVAAFKIVLPTATWAQHFLVLVVLIGLFELCLFVINILALVVLLALLTARLLRACYGLRKLCVPPQAWHTHGEEIDLESQSSSNGEDVDKKQSVRKDSHIFESGLDTGPYR